MKVDCRGKVGLSYRITNIHKNHARITEIHQNSSVEK